MSWRSSRCPLGLAIASSSSSEAHDLSLLRLDRDDSQDAFAPLFISWLGFGLLPKVIIVFLVCFFPVVLNAILAFGSLSEEMTRFIRSTGAGPLKAFLRSCRPPAAMFRRLQVCRDQRNRRRYDRRIHRQRPGARLLHSDRDRQHAARSGIRGDLPDRTRPRFVRDHHPGRTAGHSVAHFPKADDRMRASLTERYDARELTQFAVRALETPASARSPTRGGGGPPRRRSLRPQHAWPGPPFADYVEELRLDAMEKEAAARGAGSSLGAVECWDARRLPGIWTTRPADRQRDIQSRGVGCGHHRHQAEPSPSPAWQPFSKRRRVTAS